MSTTAATLITTACGLLNVYQPNEPISNTDGQLALTHLNLMMGSWTQQFLTYPTVSREVFDLVADKGGPDNPYTIGPGGDFDTDRPVSQAVLRGSALLLNNPTGANNVEIPYPFITDDAYEWIQIKRLPNSQFTAAYYNPTYANGLGTIELWPVPNGSTYDFILYRWKPLGSFSSLNASYDLPGGLDETIVYNLTLRIAPVFGREVPATVALLAPQLLNNFKRANFKMSDLPQDAAFAFNRRGGYNIQTGNY